MGDPQATGRARYASADLMANRKQPRDMFFADLTEAANFRGSNYARNRMKSARFWRGHPSFKRIP